MTDHYASRRGEGRSTKLTNDCVREIRRRRSHLRWKRKSREDKNSLVALAAEFGVSPTTISLIVHRRTWAHVE
jgi:hypothetical protein